MTYKKCFHKEIDALYRYKSDISFKSLKENKQT